MAKTAPCPIENALRQVVSRSRRLWRAAECAAGHVAPPVAVTPHAPCAFVGPTTHMAGASTAVLLVQAHESSSSSPGMEPRRRFSSLALGGAARAGRSKSILHEEADLRGQLPGGGRVADARCVRVRVRSAHGATQLHLSGREVVKPH